MGWRANALVLGNLLLATIIGLRLWKGTEADGMLRTPAQPVKVPALHADLPSLYTDFRGLADRTPFYASRRMYVQTSPAVSAPLAVPKYVFGGAVIRPRRSAVALLNNPTNGSAIRVTAGNDLEGWHVESVEASRVVLRHDGERAEIARVSKAAGQPGAAGGISRVHLANGAHAGAGNGARVLGGGGQTAGRVVPPPTSLPPLAGSGSESIYIPPPPR